MAAEPKRQQPDIPPQKPDIQPEPRPVEIPQDKNFPEKIPTYPALTFYRSKDRRWGTCSSIGS